MACSVRGKRTIGQHRVVLSPDDLAAAYADALLMHAAGTADRQRDVVAGIPVYTMGVEPEWGAQALALQPAPDPRAVRAAMSWLAEHAERYVVTARQGAAPALSAIGLTVVEELPALACRPPAPPQTSLDVRRASRSEFLTVFADPTNRDVFEAIVAPVDLANPRCHHFVGLAAGEPVACALLRVTSVGVGYVSAVAVVASHRGRGYGTAITQAAAAAAGEHGCRWAALHATKASLAIYLRLGFELVDTHVHLGSGR